MSADDAKQPAGPLAQVIPLRPASSGAPDDAAGELARRVVAELKGQLGIRERTLHTLGEVWAWWCPIYLGRMVQPEDRRNHFERYLLPAFGGLNEDQLTREVVDKAINQWLRKLSPQTVRHIIGSGRKVLNDAAPVHWSGTNPFAEVTLPKVPRRARPILTAEECSWLLEAVSERWAPLFALAIYLGPRRGEDFGLLRDDVDQVNKTITFRRSHDRDTTKTHLERTVPIPDELWPYIEEALARPHSPWLFPGEDGQRMSREINMVKVLRRALGRARIVTGWEHVCRRPTCRFTERRISSEVSPCPRCGFRLWPKPLPKEMTFHDLRHTSATLHQEAGCNPVVVQVALGHAPADITRRVYTHLSIPYMRAELNKLSLRRRTPPDGTGVPGSGVQQSQLAGAGVGRTRDLRPPEPKATGSNPVSRASESGLPRSGWLTPALVAAALSVSRAAVYAWVKAGALKARHAGARVRISAQELHQFLDRGTGRTSASTSATTEKTWRWWSGTPPESEP